MRCLCNLVLTTVHFSKVLHLSPKDHSPLPGQGESSNDISEAKVVGNVIIFCSFEVYSMSEIDISFWIPVFSDLIILAGINLCLPPRQDTNDKAYSDIY